MKFLGYYSNPAYEKVFLKATPSTKNDSVIDPPETYLNPTKFLSNKLLSNISTAPTTSSAKCSL